MLKHIKFIDNHGSFCVEQTGKYQDYLYFPSLHQKTGAEKFRHTSAWR